MQLNNILTLAIEKGLTKKGEMFWTEGMRLLAENYCKLNCRIIQYECTLTKSSCNSLNKIINKCNNQNGNILFRNGIFEKNNSLLNKYGLEMEPLLNSNDFITTNNIEKSYTGKTFNIDLYNNTCMYIFIYCICIIIIKFNK